MENWAVDGFCHLRKAMHVIFVCIELDLLVFILPPLVFDFPDPPLSFGFEELARVLLLR